MGPMAICVYSSAARGWRDCRNWWSDSDQILLNVKDEVQVSLLVGCRRVRAAFHWTDADTDITDAPIV